MSTQELTAAELWRRAHDALARYHNETQRQGHTRESVLAAWASYAGARSEAQDAEAEAQALADMAEAAGAQTTTGAEQ